MFEKLSDQEITPEILLQAYLKAQELRRKLYHKLIDEYADNASLVYQDIILDYMKMLHGQSETLESTAKTAAYHGMVGSTITPDDFVEKVTLPDLPGDKSFITFLEKKIQEINE